MPFGSIQGGQSIPEIKPDNVRLLVNFGRPAIPGCRDPMGESHISTQILQTRTAARTRSAWIAAIAIPLMLLAPALWNGYPLLQWDTGGNAAQSIPEKCLLFGAGNAFICAVISGPHDRCGARMAWLATTVALIAAIRQLTGDVASRDRSLPARQEIGDAGLVDLVADGAHVIAVRNVEHLGARNDFPERRG
jgi:hypothetical protein